MRSLSARLGSHRLDIVLGVGAFAVALAIRLPYLLLTPRYVDEFQQVFWALDIANGAHFPLTGRPSYFGPFFYYLLAFFLRLLGASVLLPRLMVAVIGALTATVSFAGGRLMWGRLAGVVAAGLVASSPVLVVNTSHYAYPNSLVPFLVTFAIVCLYAGAVRSNPWLVVSAAVLGALAVQSHPTSAVAFAGAALWYILRTGPFALLRQRSTYAALGAAFATLLPWITGLMLGGMDFMKEASKRSYAFQPASSLSDYAGRLPDLANITGIMLAGGLGENLSRFQFQVLLFAFLLLIGLILAARSGRGLLPAVLLSSFLLFPSVAVVNGDDQLRYIAFLAPVAFICVAGLVEAFISRVLSRVAQPARRFVQLFAAVILVAFGTLYPLPFIQRYYHSAEARSDSNVGYFQMLEVARSSLACGPSLFVLQPPANGGSTDFWRGLMSVHYTLLLSGCEHRFERPADILKDMRDTDYSGWVFLPPSSAEHYSENARLDPVATIAPFRDKQHELFTLFRIRPKDSPPLEQPTGN